RKVIDEGVFTHEATHQLEDYYSGGNIRNAQLHWFTEGFAEFNGNLHHFPKSDKYKFADFSNHRDQEFRGALKEPKPLTWSLNELLTIRDKRQMEEAAAKKAQDSGDLCTRDVLQSLFYAESWYWIWYCKKGPRSADLWPKFEKYVEAEISGKSGFDVFQSIFNLKIDEALEKEWLDFVTSGTKPTDDKSDGSSSGGAG